MVLGWQENLQKDEIPPEWMWTLDEDLEAWFQDVEEARKAKYSSNNSDSGGRGLERVPLMQNALSQGKSRR